MEYNYIVIEGNIGTGKTTLAKMLANDLNGRAVLEKFEDNPFLPKFYENPIKYAFPLEMSFLAERYNHIVSELSDQDLFKNFTISDYHIVKSLIFAKTNLQEDEETLFNTIYSIIFQQIPKPDLWVFLYQNPDNALKNIINRGRDYEQSITLDYLQKINQGYINFFKHAANQRVLIVSTIGLDFVSNPNDYKKIKELIFQKHPFGTTYL